MVDAVPLFDAPTRLDPTHDRVAVRLRESGICGDIVQGIAVGEEAPTLGSARMLARERNFFRIDHVPIVRSGISSAPR